MEKKFFQIDSKTKICYYENITNRNNIAIIIIHGLGEHKGRYDDFTMNMLSKDVSSFALDLRGHGESTGRRGYIRKFDDYVNDLDYFIAMIKREFPWLKLYLFGHSLGGLIVTRYLLRDNKIDGAVLSNPLFLKIKGINCLKLFPYKILGFLKIRKRISESKEMMQYSYNDPLAVNYYSIRLLGEIFLKGVPSVVNNLEKINKPLLILRGKKDPVISSRRFYNEIFNIDNSLFTFRSYEKLRHRLLQSDEKGKVMEDIYEWIIARK